MLYQEFNVTTHSEVGAHVADFADALGWTVDDVEPIEGYTAGKSLVAPVTTLTPSPETWWLGWSDVLISAAGMSIWGGIVLDEGSVLSGEMKVQLDAPMTSDMSVRLAPVKVSIFGNDGTSPWIAVVISYEYNLYRHFYIGHIVPIGGFTGGELLACSKPVSWTGSPSDPFAHWHYQDPVHCYPFGARSTGSAHSMTGGLHVVHANAAAEWHRFDSAPYRFSRDSLHPPGIVCGGFMDGFCDGYAQRARNPYAGGRILVPQNLYITDDNNGFVPVGHAPGIRLVDMIDLRPEQTVSVSDTNWKVFPAWSRSIAVEHDLRGGDRRESSHYIGYAYEEDPA